MIADVKGIGLMPLNRCNASCSHCGTNSGPRDKSELPVYTVKNVIEQAGNLYGEGWCLALSGGEVFLNTNTLKQYITHAKYNGGYSTAVTNGFWASSYQKAEDIISEVVNCGLKFLAISADNFHEPYIKYDNVINIIMAAAAVRLPIEIRVTSSRGFRLANVVKKLEPANPWFVRHIEMPLIPYGRALSIDESALILSESIPKGTCPAPSLTINHDGNAMFCCNGGGYSKNLSLGNIKTSSLKEIQNNFDNLPLGRFLIERGPLSLLESTNEMHQEFVKKRYVNECHLCISLLSSTNIDVAKINLNA